MISQPMQNSEIFQGWRREEAVLLALLLSPDEEMSPALIMRYIKI